MHAAAQAAGTSPPARKWRAGWSRSCCSSPLEPALILNVNVPDVPFAQLKGFRSSRLGFRHRSEPVMRAQDPRGRPVYWVGAAGAEQDAGPGTDFDTVARGYVR